ncbi:MAG: TerB family tellurite resistance protein, partial [Myxococcales bacterium]|nr:TerB family tellurite resistance protein [Myxococcales bacterium]
MGILRWLGLETKGADDSGDTETVRRIAARLERLPDDQARHLAAFAYVLARVAHADLEIDADEAREMERIVSEVAQLEPEEATLAVEIAKSQARLLGGTENYVVTRQYRDLSTPAQRARLLECLYA